LVKLLYLNILVGEKTVVTKKNDRKVVSQFGTNCTKVTAIVLCVTNVTIFIRLPS
jgi:hypothetical protein